MNHPLAELFGAPREDGDGKHALSSEAQRANLEEAWAYYHGPKPFVPGDIVRCRQGLSMFTNEPTILLYVRPLDRSDPVDMMIIDDETGRLRWNRINCMVMRVHDTGTAHFLPFDCGILEKVP